ncbi:PGL/p-HBAD biosynthesis glycosyltransferase [termite gut metagenome]|uniref:PGL/p-HBAD biosynthesis glycosyltransferase n=1 Tax=termite gut metagenome TaxID=433724 RepID=A0A5J4SXI2_9ZZZZ
MIEPFPLISIVTVSYNAVTTIEETILSVINQTYPNIEYIIIDGGSTDGTVDIIKKYQDKIAYWVSEPDKGIYDAMNKGIDRATGEWVNFMNAGDYFYDNNIIASIYFSSVLDNISVLYGNTLLIYENKKELQDVKPSRIFSKYKYMPSCHQSIFCRILYVKTLKFNTSYKIAADLDFFYRLYKINHNYLYFHSIIACYDVVDGISSKQYRQTYKEIIQIKHSYLIYLAFIVFFNLKLFIKSVLTKCKKYF